MSLALRNLPRPVIGRIAEDRLLLDLRTLETPSHLTGQLDGLRAALAALPAAQASPSTSSR